MIELYLSAGCPFCRKVLRATQEMGLEEGKDFVVVNAASGTPGADTVKKVGGDYMVPFLIDGDHSMYESDDIIAYLKENVVQ